MPDVWATVADLDAATQDRLADVLETRGADPRQQEMRRAFLADVGFPAGARVLEVGCGTGVLTRALARMQQVGSVVSVDLGDAGYMLSIVDRGADMLHATGEIGEELGAALKAERGAGRPRAAGSATSPT